jgi:hypothetical protein
MVAKALDRESIGSSTPARLTLLIRNWLKYWSAAAQPVPASRLSPFGPYRVAAALASTTADLAAASS